MQQQPPSSMSQRSNSSQKSANSGKFPDQPQAQVNVNRYNFDYNQSQILEEQRDYQPAQYAGQKSSDIPLIHNQNPRGSDWQQNLLNSLQNEQRQIKTNSFNYNDMQRQHPSYQGQNQNFQGMNQQNQNLSILQLLGQNFNQNQQNPLAMNEAFQSLHNQYNQSSLQQSQLQLQLLQLLQQNNSQNQLYQQQHPDPFQNKNKQQFSSHHSTSPYERTYNQSQQQQSNSNLQNLQSNQTLLQAILSQGGLLNSQNQGYRQPSYNPMYSNDNSQFTTTPLESSRSMAPEPTPQIGSFPSGVQQHNQYFVQNYASMQDNLSQYKRLISYLEQIDLQKKNSTSSTSSGNYLPSTSITIPQPQKYDNQYIDLNANQEDFEKIGGAQPKSSTNSVIAEAQVQERNPLVTTQWPSQMNNNEPKTQYPPQKVPLNYWTSNNQVEKNNENLSSHDFLSEGKIQKTSEFRNVNLIEQKKEDEMLNSSHFLNENNIKQFNEEVALKEQQELFQPSQAPVPEESQMLNSKSVKSINQNEDVLSNHIQASPISEKPIYKLSNNKKSQQSNNIEDFNEQISSAKKKQKSSDNTFMNEEPINKADEIPVAGVHMTFEELLESKLQEERDQAFANESVKKPKREFLRKGSNSGMPQQQQQQERKKSKTKYKYYADNFQNQNQQQPQPPPSEQNLSQSRLSKTPTPATLQNAQSPAVIRKTQQEVQNNKKYQTQQKPNQRQPTQQNHKSQPQRPSSQTSHNQQSQQQQQQPKTSQPARNSRHTVQPISQSNTLRPLHRDDEVVMMTDRNSIAEFEMLERECIAKCTQESPQQQPEEIFEKAKPEKPTSARRGSVKKSPSTTNSDKDSRQQSMEQKKILELKIKELEKEIQKFKKENSKLQELQGQCEEQLSRINQGIMDFEEKKVVELKEIEDWKEEQEFELQEQREQLEKEKEEYRILREMNEKKQESDEQEESELLKENETLLKMVDSLQRENDELKERIDELTDKQYHCIGVQTQGQLTFNQACNTDPVSLHNSPDKSKGTLSPSVNQYKVDDVIEEEEAEEDGSKPNSSGADDIESEEDCEIPGEEDKVEQVESDEDEYDLKFPLEYHGKAAKAFKLSEEVIGHDGKIQRIYENGKKEVIFTNGVKREVWPDGYSIVYFNNNDIKQTFSDGKIVYFFSDAKTTQTTFPNGLQVFKFANSQIEKHFIDGTKEISFPDGTIKCLFPDGEEESIFPDGTIQKIEKSGIKIIEFPSGQRVRYF